MRKLIYISLGGFAGAISRYALETVKINSYSGHIPIATLFINITGSFLLGFFLTAATQLWNVDEDIKFGISVGFLGAYTTFSTFCGESISLIRKCLYLPALSYLVMSPLLGLIAVWGGVSLARKIGVLFSLPVKRGGGE